MTRRMEAFQFVSALGLLAFGATMMGAKHLVGWVRFRLDH